MAQWIPRRQRFLDELLRLEGCGDHRHQSKCANCDVTASAAMWRCRDCFTDALFCQACLVRLHRDSPLHRVEVWTDAGLFERVTLKSLGLRIQLGHGRNGICPGTDFCIVDSNGIHEVALDFCTCGWAEDHDIQLLRARLYPATTTNPATAATFRVLRDFHLLSLEAKSSAYHFYNKLARQTDNTGVFQPRTRYAEFRRMTRQWRHLQMLKRAGRGHAADGIEGTKAGECALLCPACPQPGKNLPEDGSWKLVPRERRFLYALFLALDANFRMKRKDVSSEADDPSLGDGIAFFSQVDGYMAHLDKHWDVEQEKSTCVAHDAVDEPDRESVGTASSGIGTVDCAWHNMKHPNGVGDLQKGESLANHDDIIQLFISYDIVCQWHKNIWTRLAGYGPELHGRGRNCHYVWLIPKFHLPAHIEACNILFSFNLTPYRGWANANPLTTSTKEMGPGARRDALDDHFNDWNHKKIMGLGKFLLERAQKAIPNMSEFRLALVEAEQGLPAADLERWTKEMELWEDDPANPNPFKVADRPEDIFAIRKRLAEDAKGAQVGDAADDVRGDLHAHEMIDMGMQLEEQQRALQWDSGAAALLERSNKLGRKITEWLKIRESFAPIVVPLWMADDQARATAARLQATPALPVHAIKLWLPSRLASMPGVIVKESHACMEFALRIGKAETALGELRRLLLVWTAKWKHKDAFTRGVAANTRAKTAIDAVEDSIRRTAAEYRAARLALVNLGPVLKETEWKLKLQVLAPDDVRARPRATFSDPEHKSRKKKKKRLEGRAATEEMRKKKQEERPASWIWLSQLTDEEGSEGGMVEALRLEWAKSPARAWRWTEEVDLLEQEMDQVLRFLRWKEAWWTNLQDQRPLVVEDPILSEGFAAYAQRQSEIQRHLRLRFEGNWRNIPRYIDITREGLGVIPVETQQGVGEEQDEDEEGDGDGDEDKPIPEATRDSRITASFVEESLA
ncbi:hypothetical protein B0H14DRAFT_3090425 [Mycena olivaceomarginata]|nr:hypothetical protein B0H14DRAFT_3090425 [Mycena olivaceomarginata]